MGRNERIRGSLLYKINAFWFVEPSPGCRRMDFDLILVKKLTGAKRERGTNVVESVILQSGTTHFSSCRMNCPLPVLLISASELRLSIQFP